MKINEKLLIFLYKKTICLQLSLEINCFVPHKHNCSTFKPVFSFTSRIADCTNDSPSSICPVGNVYPFGFLLFCTNTLPFSS